MNWQHIARECVVHLPYVSLIYPMCRSPDLGSVLLFVYPDLEATAKEMTPSAFSPMPRSSTLRCWLETSVLEKRRLEERVWEPSTLEVSKAMQ
jgi:hypothetical protein